MKQFLQYWKSLQDGGAKIENIKNIASHWLYGTNINTLINLSKKGIVYNPPGH